MVWASLVGTWAAALQAWGTLASIVPAVPCPSTSQGFLEKTITYAITLVRIATGYPPCPG